MVLQRRDLDCLLMTGLTDAIASNSRPSIPAPGITRYQVKTRCSVGWCMRSMGVSLARGTMMSVEATSYDSGLPEKTGSKDSIVLSRGAVRWSVNRYCTRSAR